jgi:hypothetical protein
MRRKSEQNYLTLEGTCGENPETSPSVDTCPLVSGYTWRNMADAEPPSWLQRSSKELETLPSLGRRNCGLHPVITPPIFAIRNLCFIRQTTVSCNGFLCITPSYWMLLVEVHPEQLH